MTALPIDTPGDASARSDEPKQLQASKSLTVSVPTIIRPDDELFATVGNRLYHKYVDETAWTEIKPRLAQRLMSAFRRHR